MRLRISKINCKNEAATALPSVPVGCNVSMRKVMKTNTCSKWKERNLRTRFTIYNAVMNASNRKYA
jgi:hypothetical protein